MPRDPGPRVSPPYGNEFSLQNLEGFESLSVLRMVYKKLFDFNSSFLLAYKERVRFFIGLCPGIFFFSAVM